MSEVINVSSGPSSNHVLTHLYNVQESHIPYKRTDQIEYKNQTFMTAFKKKNGSVDYSPRALLFDFRDGLGSLNKYEYHEKKPTISNFDPIHIIYTGRKVEKNEYQLGLDQGTKVTGELLSSTNTKYWADYNKLIYQPYSLCTLENWELPSDSSNSSDSSNFGSHKHFHNKKYSLYNQGVEEFEENPDEGLENFRKLLENVDSFQGVNLFTELDSAWGGFTHELIVQLRDEYFNSNSKKQIWCWSLSSATYKPKLNHLLSRIQTFIELAMSSSVFIPLNVDTNSLMLSNLDSISPWQVSSTYAIIINSLWDLNSKLKDSVDMATLEDGLLRGSNSKRNIVNEFQLKQIVRKPKPKANQFGIMDVDLSAYYQTGSITTVGSTTETVEAPSSIDFSYCSGPSRAEYFSSNYIVPTNDQDLGPIEENALTNIYHDDSIGQIGNIDTFPKSIYTVPLSDTYVKFGINNSLKEELKTYRKIIKGLRRDTEVIEDKAELIETISDFIDEYTTGYEDESDEEYYN
ncbi:mtDNA inheritance, partitioning of the mitochondrial organelle [Scheffersomyces spartinae]|uniref:Protein DML1 n=1 Tax=Scheffersomyces spartinae TaxID=45513 RepID=A0A9P8AHC4_9ASCO|nr:mtDNA inheritance, partitioning of the mitochondrial organelle [Scheffersomyces spartinae]KAG7192553.1 mtDNA inheritance, partitioning of the mitochondrial organelle [Scheffersomyces spartinae]